MISLYCIMFISRICKCLKSGVMMTKYIPSLQSVMIWVLLSSLMLTLALVSIFSMPLYRRNIYPMINSTAQQTMVEKPTCVMPVLPISGPIEKMRSPCKKDKDWVTVETSRFLIRLTAVKKHGNITCAYVPIVRTSDFHQKYGKPVIPALNNSIVNAEGIRVGCKANDGTVYDNFHYSVNIQASERYKKGHIIGQDKESMKLSVVFLVFDSVSNVLFREALPSTYSYLVNGLSAVEFKSHNIVGDGTPQNLLPVLTGKTEEELPEARRSMKNAQYVDDHPWIWKLFHQLGYASYYAEEQPSVGTYQYRMKGFKNPPVDHYTRPFMLEMETRYNLHLPFCLGSEPRHVKFLDWMLDGIKQYSDKRKFFFGFLSEYSHSNYRSLLAGSDSDVMSFVKTLNDTGQLETTMLIVMSDHGPRFSDFRKTVKGKLEERLPFFTIRLPDWFGQKFPDAFHNLQRNSNFLTTPFDVHETLKQLLDYNPTFLNNKQRGMSLFHRVPFNRTCELASIEAHWCACLKWTEVSKNVSLAVEAAESVIAFMNSRVRNFTKKCKNLRLDSVDQLYKRDLNAQLLKYKQSKDVDGRIAQISNTPTPEVGNSNATASYIQVTFRTAPNNGLYEATLKHYNSRNQYAVDEKSISRINSYGNAPKCIAETYPHLRPYCLCKNIG